MMRFPLARIWVRHCALLLNYTSISETECCRRLSDKFIFSDTRQDFARYARGEHRPQLCVEEVEAVAPGTGLWIGRLDAALHIRSRKEYFRPQVAELLLQSGMEAVEAEHLSRAMLPMDPHLFANIVDLDPRDQLAFSLICLRRNHIIGHIPYTLYAGLACAAAIRSVAKSFPFAQGELAEVWQLAKRWFPNSAELAAVSDSGPKNIAWAHFPESAIQELYESCPIFLPPSAVNLAGLTLDTVLQ